MRYFFRVLRLHVPERQVANAVASRNLRPMDWPTRLPHTKTRRACRSSRHAVSPICTRPTSTCSFGPSRTEAQKSPHPLAFHPQKTPFPPPTPNDVSLERPRNASCWIGSEYHGFFPRSYSGHCPSSCAPLPPAYPYVHTDGRSVPGQPEIAIFTHRLWGNASEVFRSSDQDAGFDSCLPFVIHLTEPSGTQPIYSGCQGSIYIRGRNVLMSLGSTTPARPIETCG